MQLEEGNQKIFAKKRRLKDTEIGSSNTNKTGFSKLQKKILPRRSRIHEDIQIILDKGSKNNFEVKIGEREIQQNGRMDNK